MEALQATHQGSTWQRYHRGDVTADVIAHGDVLFAESVSRVAPVTRRLAWPGNTQYQPCPVSGSTNGRQRHNSRAIRRSAGGQKGAGGHKKSESRW